MLTSTPCTDLLAALLAARLEFPSITRACEAWSPKSKKTYLYADLNSIISATVPVLGAHGLLIVQSLGDGIGDTLCLTSTIFHVASGEWVRSEVSVKRPENLQDFGAASTYLKRYALQSLLNISTDEGLQALSSENLLSAFSEDSPHRYMSDPISTSRGFICPLLSPSCSTELSRVKYVPFGMI